MTEHVIKTTINCVFGRQKEFSCLLAYKLFTIKKKNHKRSKEEKNTMQTST